MGELGTYIRDHRTKILGTVEVDRSANGRHYVFLHVESLEYIAGALGIETRPVTKEDYDHARRFWVIARRNGRVVEEGDTIYVGEYVKPARLNDRPLSEAVREMHYMRLQEVKSREVLAQFRLRR